MQTDYIDVYYAHADDPSTPVEETLAAFDALIRAGKVRTIGASNFEADRLSQALALADEKELPRFIAIQPHYNLIEREYEGELREVGDREKLGCVPYFSLASGFLTGKYRSSSDGQDRVRAPRVAKYLNEKGFGVLKALDGFDFVAVPSVRQNCHRHPSTTGRRRSNLKGPGATFFGRPTLRFLTGRHSWRDSPRRPGR